MTILKMSQAWGWMEYGRCLGLTTTTAIEAAILQLYAPVFDALLLDGDAFVKIEP
jgi:hypothetical protein